MAPLIAALLPLAPPLIRFFESKIGGDKKGKERKSAVLAALAAAAEKLAVHQGDANTPRPSDEELSALIEVLFQQMAAGNVHKEPLPSMTTAPQKLYLVKASEVLEIPSK